MCLHASAHRHAHRQIRRVIKVYYSGSQAVCFWLKKPLRPSSGQEHVSQTAMHSSSPLELSLIGKIQAFMKGKESKLARATGSTLSLSQSPSGHRAGGVRRRWGWG